MTYYPNGNSDTLSEQCSDCLIGLENYCPVAFVQVDYNYEQFKKEGRFKGHIHPIVEGIMQCLIEDGKCMMKKEIDRAIARSKKVECRNLEMREGKKICCINFRGICKGIENCVDYNPKEQKNDR